MRGRQRADIARCEGLVAHGFPGRRRARRKLDQRIDAHARRNLTVSVVVRLLDLDPGQAIAEKILALAPVQRFGRDLQARRRARAGRRD